MTTPAGTDPEAAPSAEPPIPARNDLRDAIGWIVFGLVVLVGSVTMDRLERQHINPYTVPGLLPGILGLAMVTTLCVGYGVVLVGHGLPFWAASTIYVTGSILVLQRISRDADERRLGPRVIVKALVIGAASALVTHAVFQDLFLVRLP